MDVTILDKAKKIDIVSVIIGKDKADLDGTHVHMWFCPTCQNPMFQYTGKLISITPGSSPSQVRVILKCRCKTIYQINDIL